MAHLYMQHRVGDLVDVARGRNSEGGRAYVKAKRSSSPTSTTAIDSFDVEYVLTRKISKEVPPDRLSAARIDTVGRRRPASDASDVPIQPSLLSIHHQASQQLMSTAITPSPPKRQKNSNLITSTVLLGRKWDQSKGSSHHPILVYLQRNNNNNNNKGYLRRNDAKAAGVDPTKLKAQLSSDERNLVLRMKAQLTGVNKQFGVTQLIADAYGVSKRQINRWEKEQDQSRKSRSDAGSNLLTSSKLQANHLGEYQVFKRAYRRQKISQMDTLLEPHKEQKENVLTDG